MRVAKTTFLLSLTFALSAQAAQEPTGISAGAVTLQECYQRAKQISETVGISAENTRLVQAHYRAQIGAVLPHLDWIKTQFYQEKTNAGGAGVGGSLARTT